LRACPKPWIVSLHEKGLTVVLRLRPEECWLPAGSFGVLCIPLCRAPVHPSQVIRTGCLESRPSSDCQICMAIGSRWRKGTWRSQDASFDELGGVAVTFGNAFLSRHAFEPLVGLRKAYNAAARGKSGTLQQRLRLTQVNKSTSGQMQQVKLRLAFIRVGFAIEHPLATCLNNVGSVDAGQSPTATYLRRQVQGGHGFSVASR